MASRMSSVVCLYPSDEMSLVYLVFVFVVFEPPAQTLRQGIQFSTRTRK